MAQVAIRTTDKQRICVATLYPVTPTPDTPGQLFTTQTDAETFLRVLQARKLPAQIIPVPLYEYR